GALMEQGVRGERGTRRLESGQLLARLASRIHRLREPDEILETTVYDLRNHLETDRCAVLRRFGDSLEVVQQSCRDGCACEPHGVSPLTDHIDRAREQGAVAVLLEDDGGAQSVLLAPIVTRGRVNFVLTATS